MWSSLLSSKYYALKNQCPLFLVCKLLKEGIVPWFLRNAYSRRIFPTLGLRWALLLVIQAQPARAIEDRTLSGWPILRIGKLLGRY
jgi:hypothetical protein